MRVHQQQITSWPKLSDASDAFESTQGNDVWIFRGQADAKWHLETSLERVRKSRGILPRDLASLEGGLIRRFKRQYHHYSADPPEKDNYIEWLALMQHHGAPTRLLDWTYSFFVAVFFAVESGQTPAAVWALNTTALFAELREQLPDITDEFDKDHNVRSSEIFQKTFGKHPPATFACQLNPYRLSQRLTIQQGIFVCPGNVGRTFEENLAAVIGDSPPPDYLVKLVISPQRKFRHDLLQRLHRMNMNRATLFPGLDGFSRSLEQLLAFPNLKTFLPPD